MIDNNQLMIYIINIIYKSLIIVFIIYYTIIYILLLFLYLNIYLFINEYLI